MSAERRAAIEATAVIAAAGSGERLGAGGPKAYVGLAGQALLAHSLAAIAAVEGIRKIVIAAPPDEPGRAGELLAEMLVARGRGLDGEVVPGGGTRAESVAVALTACEGELIAVHDAARPLAPPELFAAVLGRLAEDPGADAAIAAAPLADTVKLGTGETAAAEEAPKVEATLARERLWAAQTPQAFRAQALRDAQRRAAERGELEAATDEAALIEAAGGSVLIEPAPPSNLKITTPDDLIVAEALLAARR